MNLIAYNKIIPAVNQIEVNVFYQRQDELNFNQEMNIQVEAWSPLARGKNNVFDHPSLIAIAQNHNKSVAQIIIKWLIQRNIVVIVKTQNEARLKENINVFDFELSSNEVEEIKKININQSCFFDQRDVAAIKKLTNYQK